MKVIVESFYRWYSSKVSNPKYRWAIILGTLLYLVSPFDISPDFLPIIGWIDDGAVLAILTTELTRLVVEQRSRRKVNIQPDVQEKSEKTVDVQATAV